MTPGNNGASTPEDDDPFGYLYADGQANGAQPPTGGYGYPGSVSRVRTVGERQYGQPQAPAYGQVPQQQAYGRPNARYAAPETLPGAAVPTPPTAPPAGGGRGRGPNTRGLLIGAIAVVAAVVVGIGVAMVTGGSDSGKNAANSGASSTPTVAQSASPSPSASASTSAGELPKIDAKALRLGGGATTASDVKGAKADGGVYVAGFNQVGASVTWTVDVDKTAGYRLYVRYAIPGVDANATLTVNGTASSVPLNMKNFSGQPQGDWAKGWQTTWALVNLNKGTNTIQVGCNAGNQCNAYLDQFSLTSNG